MKATIELNSNHLITLANELGTFLENNGINYHRDCFGISEMGLKCLIADYLWKKYNLTDEDDYFSAKYNADMRFISCDKCGE